MLLTGHGCNIFLLTQSLISIPYFSHAGLLLICYSHAMAVVDRARFSIPCVSWLDSPEGQDDDDCGDDDDGDSGGDDNIKHLTCEIHAQASASTELSGLSQCRVLCTPYHNHITTCVHHITIKSQHV